MQMCRYKVQEISINCGLYPPLLKRIPTAPSRLFVKGNITEGYFGNCLGIVGSRQAGIYIKKVVKFFVRELADTNIVVVSGFMSGVDFEAHKNAVDFGLRTVAVPPCGLEVCCNSSNSRLYEQILCSEGLIVSEFENDFQPQKWSYPKRNRVVAGICSAVLVVGARESSGSLLTAGYARDFGRKVWSVPGDIFDDKFVGSNRIISEYAQILYSIEPLLEFFNIQKSRERVTHSTSTAEEKLILQSLSSRGSSMDEILCQTSLSISEINKVLGNLVLNGVIVEDGGLYYVN